MWNTMYKELDNILRPTLDKNVIIYGPNGGFVQWFYRYFYNKEIKCIIDRWNVDQYAHIQHLMSLYYMWDVEDVIINTTPKRTGPQYEFNEIGEDWSRVKYTDEQIIELYDYLYGDAEGYSVSFYDYLEYKANIDLLTTIRRKDVQGELAHGYYPTDFRLMYEAFFDELLFDINDRVLDIGCGKGASIISLWNLGYKNIGGVEFTNSIFNSMLENFSKLEIPYTVGNDSKNAVMCYNNDATLLEYELDDYNVFFFFNPFALVVFQKVFENILSSLERRNRCIKIVYAEPIGHFQIMDSGKFQMKKSVGFNIDEITYTMNVYISN